VATKTAGDRIRLAGVKLHTRIGVTPEERGTSQECEADLTLWMDFEAAAATDALENSIDYCRVLETARRVSEACEYRLLETLAYRIARALLGEFPVHRVGLKLRKRPESLRGRVDFVEVEVEEP
jgi:dihydroneopterin aldolase